MKECIIKVNDDGSYKMPLQIKLRSLKNVNFKLLYKEKYYTKECNNKNIKQLTQVVEALNIKDKKERFEYAYDKACEILDSDFYGKNVCEFKSNKCIHDRMLNISNDGCCRSRDGKKACVYLKNHICSISCLACKFHICSFIRKKGLKYRINDILVLRYLLNWKQKIMAYLDFFKTKEEVIEDLLRNSIIIWALKKGEEKFFEVKK